jgi:hypothetical protein
MTACHGVCSSGSIQTAFMAGTPPASVYCQDSQGLGVVGVTVLPMSGMQPLVAMPVTVSVFATSDMGSTGLGMPVVCLLQTTYAAA